MYNFNIKTNVIKRDGREERFDINKVLNAIEKSTNNQIEIKNSVYNKIFYLINYSNVEGKISVEEIQDIIINVLYEEGYEEISNRYKEYRDKRNKTRDTKSDIMNTIVKIGKETDRDNANVGNNFSAKLLRIASEANKWTELAVMPKDLARLHENGDYHIHDLDSYNLATNCLHIPTGKMLRNGFNTGYGYLRPAKRIDSAAALSCILLQSSQNDCFGGQSLGNYDNDMAYFVDLSRKQIYKEEKETLISMGVNVEDYKKKLQELVENKIKRVVQQAMQEVVYNLNTMHSRAGSQVPFSSVNIGIPLGTEQEKKDSALLCETFLKEYDKGLGKGEACIFPNIIFLVKKGVNKNPEDPYYYLFELACDVASRRMNPTFLNIDASFNIDYFNNGIVPMLMGCRTRVLTNVNGEATPVGRGNIAPISINLPRLGLLANKNIDSFFELLDKRLNQSKLSLMDRYNVLKQLKVKDIPFSAGQGLMKGSEDLSPDDSIEPILKQGTWGIGFIGLAETLVALTGKHHGESEEMRDLGYRIVKHIRDFCNECIKEYKLNFSCYASPAEGISGRFVTIDKEKFGIIEGVTDKDYYTNSFHIPVGYKISMCDKIKIEAPYHELCNAGHITYVEFDDYPTGKMIEKTVSSTFENTDMDYLACNFHIKYCRECGTYLSKDAEECTCGSTNIQGISRVTGYLSLDERFGYGKAAERKDRLAHTNGERAYSKNI